MICEQTVIVLQVTNGLGMLSNDLRYFSFFKKILLQLLKLLMSSH